MHHCRSLEAPSPPRALSSCTLHTLNELDDVCAGYMGVTKLWSTVEPVCENASFFSTRPDVRMMLLVDCMHKL